jgi:hypothetical protein
MSNVNAADPFGLVAKTQAAMSATTTGTSTQESSAVGEEPTTNAKPKRTYTRRTSAAAGPVAGSASSDEQSDELVLGFFSTGALLIQLGKQVMHLSVEQRGKLAHFLELVAP